MLDWSVTIDFGRKQQQNSSYDPTWLWVVVEGHETMFPPPAKADIMLAWRLRMRIWCCSRWHLATAVNILKIQFFIHKTQIRSAGRHLDVWVTSFHMTKTYLYVLVPIQAKSLASPLKPHTIRTHVKTSSELSELMCAHTSLSVDG